MSKLLKNLLKISLASLIIFIAGQSQAMDKSDKFETKSLLKEYRCLSHDDKEKLLKESQEMLDVPIDNRFHPLRDQTSFQTLISAAKEINGRYKDSTIVSLGQSPAYLIKAAEILNEMDPTTTQNEYKYLAFSHKFFYRSSGDDI